MTLEPTFTNVEPGSLLTLDNQTLQLRPTTRLTIAGVARRADGTPVASTSVSLSGEVPSSFFFQRITPPGSSVTTNAQGQFSFVVDLNGNAFSGALTGRFRLDSFYDGQLNYGYATFTNLTSGQPATVNTIVEPPSLTQVRVRGTITDLSSAPVNNASVRVRYNNLFYNFSTDAQGNYSGDIPVGHVNTAALEYVISSGGTSYTFNRSTTVTPGTLTTYEQDFSINLTRLQFVGTLQDTAGNPIAGSYIRVYQGTTNIAWIYPDATGRYDTTIVRNTSDTVIGIRYEVSVGNIVTNFERTLNVTPGQLNRFDEAFAITHTRLQLQGTVSDGAATPLASASIAIFQNGTYIGGTSTDATGAYNATFTVLNQSPANLTFEISYNNAEQTFTRNVNVVVGTLTTATRNFTFTAQPVINYDARYVGTVAFPDGTGLTAEEQQKILDYSGIDIDIRVLDPNLTCSTSSYDGTFDCSIYPADTLPFNQQPSYSAEIEISTYWSSTVTNVTIDPSTATLNGTTFTIDLGELDIPLPTLVRLTGRLTDQNNNPD
ncbi:MAG: hypothetical protein HC893_12625 [Chloroflexaceae bacterium]|nr:hypothetical protein [Chloroflexaceae bacterium]